MDHNSIKNRELNFKSRLSTSINFKFVCHHILYNWNFACNRIFRIYPFDDRRIKSDLRTIFALIKNMIKNEFTKRIAQGNSIILAISPTNRRFDLAKKKKKNRCLLSLCLGNTLPSGYPSYRAALCRSISDKP